MEVHEPQSKTAKVIIESSSLEDLNDDLIIEILCRLPYKDIVRWRCVSKNWLSLICSPQFMACYKLQWTFIYFSNGVPKLTSSDDVFKSPGFSLRFLPFYKAGQKDSRVCILKTFNDLVLCCEARDLYNVCEWPWNRFTMQPTYMVYYVCNPLTRQWVSLPPIPQYEGGDCVDFICELAKDNQIKHRECKFKVVSVPRIPSKTEIKVQIFSTEIGRWKEISTSMPVCDGLESIYVDEAVICNNKLIMFGSFSQHPDCRKRPMNINIVIFDIFNGGTRSVNHYHHIFTVSLDFYGYTPCGLHRMAEGGLRIARVHKLKSHPVIKIWELREENNYEWRLMEEVNFQDVVSECKWVSEYYLKTIFTEYYLPSVFGFDPNDVNILYMNLRCNGLIGKYDIQRRSLNIADHTPLAFLPSGKVKLLVLQLRPTLLPTGLQVSNHNKFAARQSFPMHGKKN